MTVNDAARYASALLSELGLERRILAEMDSPPLAWRRCGSWTMTGREAGNPWMCPAGLASVADGVLLALRSLSNEPDRLPERGSTLIGERGRLLGLTGHGRISANGFCRLLEAADGRIALNLARESDWALVPVLIRGECKAGDWETVQRRIAALSVEDLLGSARELGIPLAKDAHLPARNIMPQLGACAACTAPRHQPRVVELASLWAGPLAGSLLASMGAQVCKVESPLRLDGTRAGHAVFFHLLNEGKRMLSFDFRDREEVAKLKALLELADIVLEGSRPRALEQIGIDRQHYVSRGAIWVSITAHEDPHRVGFGDDAGVEAGLARMMEEAWGEPVFVGDAISDPLTGLHAALAAWACWTAGAARWIPMSLSGTTAFAMAQAPRATGEQLRDWQEAARTDTGAMYSLRTPVTRAGAAGADNPALDAILRASKKRVGVHDQPGR